MGKDARAVFFGQSGRRDAVGFVVGLLLSAASLRLAHRARHGIRDFVGVKNGHAVHVARSTSNGLHKRTFASQKTLFVGVHNGDQGDFRKIKPFPKQVHPNQHVKESGPQRVHDFNALHGFHVAVNVAAANPVAREVLRELLGHSLGQRGDQHPFVTLASQPNLFHQVVDLVFDRAHLDDRVQQPGGPNQLLDDDAFRLFELIVCRRRRHINRLVLELLKFAEHERTVVHCGRQAEPVFHQIFLSASVATIHGANLG